MKKKLLLILLMFLFITNVKALTFNIDITNIEDEGNNGTIGSIETINIGGKTLDVIFHDKGDEVNFKITITNTGSKVKLLRSISFDSGNPSIKYTSNIPETGLVIDGFDKNEILVTARLTETPVNGKSASKITIRYVYEEGICPKGEVLSDDERTCLCLDGTERNEQGICVTPEKPVECATDEIYNEEKKICEKKVIPVVPVNPSNPKTFDNIVLISLLFIVSGLGIYAAMFKKLNTNKKKVTAGVITGVVTLSLSFTVLASVFGLNNLLGAIADIISEERILIVDVNEEIDLIETWDGECSLDTNDLTPENIFDGGSGTESDPYQVKNAEQLSCFAKSVNEGNTYEGQFVKQTRSIKLNEHLNEQAASGDLSNAHVWTPAGYYYYYGRYYTYPFKGTYDGNNYVISGLYIVNDDANYETGYGLFGTVDNAVLKNIQISDAYLNCEKTFKCAAVVGAVFHSVTIDNVKTYGNGHAKSGIISKVENPDGNCGDINIYNSVNNINGVQTGFIDNIYGGFTINFENVINNGEIVSSGFSGGMIGYAMNIDNTNFKNVANKGNIVCTEDDETQYVGGIVGDLTSTNTIVDNVYNTGNITNCDSKVGGLFGEFRVYDGTINNSFNSGNITNAQANSIGGLVGYESIMTKLTVKKSFNTGNIQTEGYGRVGGLLGETEFHGDTLIEDCYNTGDITTTAPVVGGLVADIDGLIKNSYNKGKITTSTSWGYVGGLVATGDYSYRYVDVENSYNEGEIILNSDDTGVWLGGICGICGDVKNSYNKGNITSKNYDKYIGGITGRGKTVSNSYNSGNITITNGGLRTSEYDEKVSYSGIMVDGDAITNSYNLGNISLNDDGTNFPTILAAGIGIGDFPVSNSVNSGNIKLNVNNKYTGPHIIGLYGTTSSSDSTNNYNLGLVELDDSTLDDPISEDDFNGEHHIITISNSINDSVPDILSIINGDDAFEIKEGEILPTLKVFN